MNREFKFRVWNREMGGWDHPSFLQDWDDNNGITFKCLPEENYVIQQYTEIKDKNQKEIFEGDIMKYDRPGFITKIGIVEFFAGNFVFGDWREQTEEDISTMMIGYMEVIGNIFNNPEIIG